MNLKFLQKLCEQDAEILVKPQLIIKRTIRTYNEKKTLTLVNAFVAPKYEKERVLFEL